MNTLNKNLRRQLEDAVKTAREVAEKGARAALTRLAVDQAEPFPHLSLEQKQLRNRLRARARQLGDRRDARGQHGIEHLSGETAYEHWHRMLFARFLAENHLLMYPEGVAVSLADCEELAAEEGAQDAWELAGRYAARMLPQIFRPDEPVLAVALAPEHQRELERLVVGLPTEVFTASDSLGWVYQFWQARRKEEVNRSEVKIGADELPAVTQLFTEPYMVSFLLDNSLGTWWAARRLTDDNLKTAESEEELRQKASLPGVPLEYLRFVKTEDDIWTPAAGTFNGWPEHLSELKILDPCCGSGHFLVATFLMLVPMRMALEGLSAQDAVDAVLRDNLHGLEIDRRCVELAVFALALTAWHYPKAGGYRQLPELNVACSGLAISAKKEEWLSLAGDNTDLRLALEELYKQFKDAPVVGSLINPEVSLGKGSLFELKWEEVGPLLTHALSEETDEERTEMSVVAKGLAKAANLLISKYDLLITNVPYLARGKQDHQLQGFCETHYRQAKTDLAISFLVRCLEFSKRNGVTSLVLPQSWLSQVSYKSLRGDILRNQTIRLVNRLGKGAFETISGEVVNVILLTIERNNPLPFSEIRLLDADKSLDKIEFSAHSPISCRRQVDFLNSPDSIISFSGPNSNELPTLNAYVDSLQGIKSGDDGKFCRNFWEFYEIDGKNWCYEQSTTLFTAEYSGRYKVINWELRGEFARLQGNKGWNRYGIIVNQMANLFATIHTGHLFDGTVSCLVPKEEKNLAPVFAFCSAPEYVTSVRAIESGVAVANSILAKVPFDVDYWTQVAAEQYPNGLPKPYSDDPTQWLFHGHPAKSTAPLQVAVARLLGYRWPAELDKDMELTPEAREWIARCRELDDLTDQDGIVCLSAVRGEQPAHLRLQSLLARAYGEDWSPGDLERLLIDVGYAGKSLDAWLRDAFFQQHCELFHQRPFIWHIWDGRRRDGFSALVNYHKLDRKRLETLTYTYLGDWITRQEAGARKGEDGAEERLLAARDLQRRLELILEGEQPYDVFVRWKPIETQPIGWEPDLNDGVRLNIRPFVTAGVLRKNPKNLNWKKDRGKDPESAPWFKVFGGERINDWHLSLEEKRRARERVKESKVGDAIDTLLENPIPVEDAKPVSRDAIYRRQR